MTAILFAVLLQIAVQLCLRIYFIFHFQKIKKIALIAHVLIENAFIHNAA